MLRKEELPVQSGQPLEPELNQNLDLPSAIGMVAMMRWPPFLLLWRKPLNEHRGQAEGPPAAGLFV